MSSIEEEIRKILILVSEQNSSRYTSVQDKMVSTWPTARDFHLKTMFTNSLRVIFFTHLAAGFQTHPYDVNTPSTRDNVNLVMDSRPEKGAAVLAWDHSTTSSITVSWSLSPHRNGSIFSAQVDYVLPTGQFKSDMLPMEVRNFTFDHLKVDTTYRVCVKLYEKIDNGAYYDTLEHYACAYVSTLPYIRRDSVLALMLTLGYFLFLTVVAYVNWRKDLAAVQKRRRRNSSRNEPACHVVRWRDVAERQQLCIPTSIEDDGPHDL